MVKFCEKWTQNITKDGVWHWDRCNISYTFFLSLLCLRVSMRCLCFSSFFSIISFTRFTPSNARFISSSTYCSPAADSSAHISELCCYSALQPLSVRKVLYTNEGLTFQRVLAQLWRVSSTEQDFSDAKNLNNQPLHLIFSSVWSAELNHYSVIE